MPAEASRRGAAKDRALDHVKTQILTGEFAGGELISEGDVATALGMSRTPVREAFLRLEAEGLLRLYPQRGALVVPVSPEEVRAVMEADRAFHAITLEESGNAILSNFYSALRDRQMRMIGESALREPDRVATIMTEHRGIAEALRDGDPALARHAVRTHLISTVRAMGLSVEQDPVWAT